MNKIPELQQREAALVALLTESGLTTEESKELSNIRQDLERLQYGRPSADDTQPLCMGTSF